MKSIIFDLDDTLYVDKNLRRKREEAILRLVEDKIRAYNKLRETKSTVDSLTQLGIPKEQFDDVFKKVPISLRKNIKLKTMLEKLKDNYNLIVLSNSPTICVNEILKQLGVLDLIDDCYGGDNFSDFKPAEECFFMVKEGDICVGNNFAKDLLVPKRFGAVTVHLTDEENSEADFKINSIYELEKILE